jgi:predicted MFS family arabinose efflux permease
VSWRRSPAVLLAALTGLNLINYVDRGMTGAVLPLITKDFHLSGFEGGLLGSLFFIIYLVVAPLAGWLADHRPRLRLAGFGVLIWMVATVSSGLAPAFMVLLLARAMSGVGEATYAVVTPSLLSDTYPRHRRAAALAIFYAALPVGAAAAYVIGTNVGPAFGWRVAYLCVFPPALLLCLLMFALREPARGLHEGGASAAPPVSLRRSLHALVQRRSYVYNTFAQAIFTFTLGGMWLWVPTFLSEERGIPLSTAGTWFGALLVVSGIGGTIVGGRAGDALARRFRSAHFTFSAAATLLAVPFIAIALHSRSQWVLWPCTFVGLFLLFTITGPLQASMMNVLPANLRGRAVAVYTVTIHLFGDVLSQPLMGLAKDAVGLEIPMIAAILFLGVSGLLLILGRHALVRDLDAMADEPTSVSLAEQQQAGAH